VFPQENILLAFALESLQTGKTIQGSKFIYHQIDCHGALSSTTTAESIIIAWHVEWTTKSTEQRTPPFDQIIE